MLKWIPAFILLTAGCKSIQPKTRIIVDDVVHFIQVMDSLEFNTDTGGLFQRLVIDQATEEFKPFMAKWGMTSKQYTSSFRKYPKFYQSLKHSCQPYLITHDSIIEAIKRFKHSYPNFHPAEICMGIGTFRTGGNVHINKSKRLVYIGLEFHAVDEKRIFRKYQSYIKITYRGLTCSGRQSMNWSTSSNLVTEVASNQLIPAIHYTLLFYGKE